MCKKWARVCSGQRWQGLGEGGPGLLMPCHLAPLPPPAELCIPHLSPCSARCLFCFLDTLTRPPASLPTPSTFSYLCLSVGWGGGCGRPTLFSVYLAGYTWPVHNECPTKPVSTGLQLLVR